MKLLDEMRAVMQRRHYSIRTERSYCAWATRYVHFHKMKSRADLKDGERRRLRTSRTCQTDPCSGS
ncbi:MAG: phage integrase N-terminal SAM-like domain-containing protein [Planctomycetes bacterium]|nr:phage integrase N-terminal SAM-like domain-containing protein [Planctomycetota bacterium]